MNDLTARIISHAETAPMVVGYIISLNEAEGIGRTISSLQEVTPEIVVVDSGSVDGTADIAVSLGARLVYHPFEGFSQQRNWTLDYIARLYGPCYILACDGDEWLDERLIEALRDLISGGRLQEHDVYLIRRAVCFSQRLLRWGGMSQTWLPRLFRSGIARYEKRVVNEHLTWSEEVAWTRLPGHIVNGDAVSWVDYIDKHNRYSSLEAEARVQAFQHDGRIAIRDVWRQPHLRRRWLRQHVWDRLPARPLLRFVQLYVLSLGLLDGRAGYRRAVFEAWQEMCTDLKAERIAQGRRP